MIVLPPKELREQHGGMVIPLYPRVSALSEEIKVLDKPKALLLPRLISGKLSVEDLDSKFPPYMQEVVE